jgi:hypothetical protein
MVRWAVMATIAVICVVGSAYLYWRTSTVLVENRSDVVITEVQVKLGGETFWSGELGPAESHRAFGFVTPDDIGDLVISFKAEGRTLIRTFPSGFTTAGVHHRLAITSALDVQCEWTNSGSESGCGDLSAVKKMLGVE